MDPLSDSAGDVYARVFNLDVLARVSTKIRGQFIKLRDELNETIKPALMPHAHPRNAARHSDPQRPNALVTRRLLRIYSAK
ncbi:hypothetical protein RSOLAG22IIIB_11168 [Rhizoctonia solani]|uniref:Uncharacterized protein n=1 Tax=Rhizoctonia solani TaxID=456999 RepID=A0A0K6G7B0_9AGAM|nr:hypothetical protein RSOLAG22IIIB_11168 [Rhizoctonia solani]